MLKLLARRAKIFPTFLQVDHEIHEVCLVLLGHLFAFFGNASAENSEQSKSSSTLERRYEHEKRKKKHTAISASSD